MADSSSSLSNEAQYQFKYKGVRKRKWGKYVCEIRLPNSRERIWLGSYDTAEKAARAFDAALFCLRGRNANFNFPDDPPNIIGGHLLTPTEIQAVAQQYGNQYSYSSSNQPPPRPLSNVGDVEFRAESMNSIDWSFLDTLDSNVNGGNPASVSDFGLFPEPGDVYIPPQFESTGVDNGNCNHDDGDHENSGNIECNFLWNF